MILKKIHGFIFLFLLASIILWNGCTSHKKQATDKAPAGERIPVIFETDIGNDVDDALALAMLNSYINTGRVNLLGVMYNKDNVYSGKFIDIVDSWYGHPEIPIGSVIHGKTKENPSYTKTIVGMTDGGKHLFPEHYSGDSFPDAVKLYRQLLWKAKDSSVVIVSVGFSTNLARLLRTRSDHRIPLNGSELIRKKVRLLSMMAGCFNDTIEKEYNIYNDVKAAYEVFNSWPTKIIVSPYEVGIQIKYPASSILHDFGYVKYHPVAEAYKAFMKMPYNRPCWDLTAVLQAIEPDSSFFTISSPGKIAVDTLTAKTNFTEVPGGNHRYLTVDSIQAARIKKRLIKIVTMVPQKYQK